MSAPQPPPSASPGRPSRPKLALAILSGIVLFGALMGRQRGAWDAPSAPNATSAVEEPPIPYTEVQSWPIQFPDTAGGQLVTQGYGKMVVIDSAYRTEHGLRRLGDQLRQEVPGDKRAVFEVHTDSVSAARRQRGMLGKLPRGQQRRFDRSHVGVYHRNRPSSEFWSFGVDGMTSDSVEPVTITY